MKQLKSGDKYHFVLDEKGKAQYCLVYGKPTNYKELDFPEARQHARWQLIEKDLEFVEVNIEEALKRIKEATKSIILDRRNIESVIIKALIESAVVGYIKCFNQAKGRKVKLEHNNYFREGDGKKFAKIHHFIKELRNTAIAHAGESNNENSLMFAVYDPTSDNSPLRAVAHANYRIPDIEKLEEFLELIQYVKEKSTSEFNIKLNKFRQKLINNAQKYGLEEFTK